MILNSINNFILAYRFNLKEALALIHSVAGKNISLAIGLASQFFSPLTVVMLAVNPLIQMPVMTWILRWSPRLFQKEKGPQQDQARR